MHQPQLPTEVANTQSFYLPRASISSASNSTGTSSKSSSRSREYTPNSIDDERLRRRNVEEEISELNKAGDGESESEGASRHEPYHHIFNHEDDHATMPIPYVAGQAGMPSLLSSTSSSSSAGSNQSNYSVNSLLLSVKNLENFNRANDIDRKQQSHHHHHHQHYHHHQKQSMPSEYNPNITLKSNYYLNYFINQEKSHFPLYEHRWKMLQNIRNIAMDEKNMPSVSIGKETEADQLSTTSSTTTTNFTVISLNDSSQRLNKSRKAICRRSHTISIVVFVMTTIFVIFISVMLLLMDMRNQKMPR